MTHDDDAPECACMDVMRDRVISAAVDVAVDSFFSLAVALTPPEDGEENRYDPGLVALMVDMLTSEVICRISARGTEDHALFLHAKNVRAAITAHRASEREGMQ